MNLFTKVDNLREFPRDKTLYIVTMISTFFTFVILLIMSPMEAELKSLTPYGVMELEFAWTIAQIDKILVAWGSTLIQTELDVTYLDFCYLIAYSTALAGVTLILTRKVFRGKMKNLGYRLMLVPFLAAFFDVIENVNIIFMLTSPSSFPAFAPLVTSVCATIKFSLLIGTVIFWLIGCTHSLLKRKS